MLAVYACDPALTKGRMYPEPAAQGRNEFQRDRDRIIHSGAFRRLEYKTQVFVNHEGDLFRTRLTHSLEVAQITRSVARRLGLHEDLSEAIALAHDLGHTPFGHAGQEALNECMQKHAPDAGGFEHNLQSLRVVDELEQRYAAFDGLNLTFETREGILKHCARARAERLGAVAERFLLGRRPSLEAQLANVADAVAYVNHDIDDGLRSGLLTLRQLDQVPMWGRIVTDIRMAWPHLPERRLIHEAVRRMIDRLVSDLSTASDARIAQTKPQSVDDVRLAPPLVGFSDAVHQEIKELKAFLMQNLYRHYKVMREMGKAQRVVRELFEAFLHDPRLLPPQDAARAAVDNDTRARAIADYIAGMTDRFAIREWRKIYQIGVES